MKHRAWLACALICAAPQVFSQDWIPLQDGKTLKGWKPAENPKTWVVEKGVFVTRGDRSHLFYVGKVANHEFRNFELSAEVYTEPGSNSGIYVHTKLQGPGWPEAGYELQVINSNPPAERMGGYVEHKMTGSIYAVRNTWVAPVHDNEWFNYRIRVVGKTIQTFINDRLICEYAEPANAYRPADKKGRLLGSGTFALQAHDPGSVVKYRNIRVKILSEDAAPPAGLVPLADRELDQLVTQLSNDNVPLIDFGLVAPDGADDSPIMSVLRRHGMTLLSAFPHQSTDVPPPALLLFYDSEVAPDVAKLKAAKAAGIKMAFMSKPGATTFDEAQFKRRLELISEARLNGKDFWIPGK
ncbi:MAG TPA: DUF1080 domain-containing protein [Steroidobacteraceae bacterium]|nr:DUF1080 domain-containing protein [Steroidobacteraceae bacterium]